MCVCVCVNVCVLRGGGGGCGAYLKNRDQIDNVGMIGHASSEDTWVLGESGGMLPQKILKFENLKLLETHSNCQFYHDHVILYHFKYFTIPSGGPFWSPWGEGMRAHPTHLPPAHGPG